MTASEHTELLPCPLCGGKAEVIFVTGMAYDWRARCANPNCGANVRFTANSPLEDDPRRAAVIAAWNKRATHDPASVADAARLMVDAWEVLPEGRHSISVMQKWILDDLKPAVDRVRVALASRATDRAEPVPVAWECAKCGCKSFARVDMRQPDGSFAPGPDVRCVNCKIVSIFPQSFASPTGMGVTEEQVERAMAAFIASVREQDPEWTDELDEEVNLTSPSGDYFAPYFPVRAALVAALHPTSETTEAGNGWQPIETAPMEDGAEYLVWDGHNITLINVHSGSWWALAEFTVDDPTHWMPLPTPPEARHG